MAASSQNNHSMVIHAPRPFRFRRAWSPVFAALGLIGTTYLAQPAHASDPNDEPDEVTDQVVKTAQLAGGKDLLVAPIPISNPTFGTGLILGGVVFYNPNDAPSPWISGAAIMKTTTDIWFVGGLHSMSLQDDRYRINVSGGTGNIIVDYYGIGADAGDRDVSVKLNQKSVTLTLDGQTRIAPHFYAGARLQFLDNDASIPDPDPDHPDIAIPVGQENTSNLMVGPVATYDTRDDSLNPGRGILAKAQFLKGFKVLGGDFTSTRFTALADYYFPAGPSTVIALRGSVCTTSKNMPFYGLCLYGKSNDLRGYEAGRYRDRASWAAQAEVRQKLSGRFGAVAFAGFGGIAPSLSQLSDSKFLPSAGAGLRYRPSKQTNINLRLDFAVGRDAQGVYVGIGEAF